MATLEREGIAYICVVFCRFAGFSTLRWDDKDASCHEISIAKYFLEPPWFARDQFGVYHLCSPRDTWEKVTNKITEDAIGKTHVSQRALSTHNRSPYNVGPCYRPSPPLDLSQAPP